MRLLRLSQHLPVRQPPISVAVRPALHLAGDAAGLAWLRPAAGASYGRDGLDVAVVYAGHALTLIA